MENLTLKDILYEKDKARQTTAIEAQNYSMLYQIRNTSPLRTQQSAKVVVEQDPPQKSPPKIEESNSGIYPGYEVIKHKTAKAFEDGPPL